jgi:hypothetical protein
MAAHKSTWLEIIQLLTLHMVLMYNSSRHEHFAQRFLVCFDTLATYALLVKRSEEVAAHLQLHAHVASVRLRSSFKYALDVRYLP